MKFLHCICLFLLALPATGTPPPPLPVLVVGPVRPDAHITNQRLPETVRTALISAFAECNEISVQMDHQYQSDTPEEKIRQLKEIEEMIIANYIDHRRFDQLNPADKARINTFRAEIQTRYLVFGQLLQNPLDAEREYSLTIHVVEVATWAYVFSPETIEFNMRDIQTQKAVKQKVVQMIREKGRNKGFCLGRDPQEKARTLRELDQAVRRLVLAEWFFPRDPEIQHQVAEYIQSEVTYEHYLHQKLIVMASMFRDYQRKGPGFAPQLSRELAGHLIGTLEEVIGMNTDPLQQEGLRAKQRYYQEYLQKQTRKKTKPAAFPRA